MLFFFPARADDLAGEGALLSSFYWVAVIQRKDVNKPRFRSVETDEVLPTKLQTPGS